MTTHALAPSEDQARIVFDLLVRISGLSNAAMGKRIGVSGSSIQAKRAGTTPISLGDADRYAIALGVPREILNLTPQLVLRWIADNPWYAAGDSNPEPTVIGSNRAPALALPRKVA